MTDSSSRMVPQGKNLRQMFEKSLEVESGGDTLDEDLPGDGAGASHDNTDNGSGFYALAAVAGVGLALAGKKFYDKRQTIKERETARETARHLKT